METRSVAGTRPTEILKIHPLQYTAFLEATKNLEADDLDTGSLVGVLDIRRFRGLSLPSIAHSRRRRDGGPTSMA